jgi:hypothetical protein
LRQLLINVFIRNQQVDGSNPPASSTERKHGKAVVLSAFSGVCRLSPITEMPTNQRPTADNNLRINGSNPPSSLRILRIRNRFRDFLLWQDPPRGSLKGSVAEV